MGISLLDSYNKMLEHYGKKNRKISKGNRKIWEIMFLSKIFEQLLYYAHYCAGHREVILSIIYVIAHYLLYCAFFMLLRIIAQHESVR